MPPCGRFRSLLSQRISQCAHVDKIVRQRTSVFHLCSNLSAAQSHKADHGGTDRPADIFLFSSSFLLSSPAISFIPIQAIYSCTSHEGVRGRDFDTVSATAYHISAVCPVGGQTFFHNSKGRQKVTATCFLLLPLLTVRRLQVCASYKYTHIAEKAAPYFLKRLAAEAAN